MIIPLRTEAAFMLCFLWMFLPHRYNRPVTACILAVSYVLTGFTEYKISSHTLTSLDGDGVAAIFIEVLIVLATAVVMGEHRDSRSVLIGLSACTFYLAAFMTEALLYFYTGNFVVSMIVEIAFSVIIILVIYANNKSTPLTELLEIRQGRWGMCFIPGLCFVSIILANAFMGNIFTDPVCRPITVVMIILMFVYYFIIVSFLRMQSRARWLDVSNSLLEAYSTGLKQQLEHMETAQEEIAIMRHDIRHRLNLVGYYLDTGNTDAIREMISATSARLDETVIRRLCLDNTMNWVLQQAALKAEKENITFECEADIDKLPSEIEFGLGVVVLNLLENALNSVSAVADSESRKVEFAARPVKGQLFIEVKNSYSGRLRFSPETGLPLSPRGEGHGNGLRSVMAFAKKYNASFDCRAENGVFYARLLMKTAQTDTKES